MFALCADTIPVATGRDAAFEGHLHGALSSKPQAMDRRRRLAGFVVLFQLFMESGGGAGR